MRRTIPTVLTAMAAAGLLAACSSSSPTAAATPVAVATSDSPTPAPTAPTPSECSSFASVYDNQVEPLLDTSSTGNLGWTEQADAWTALAKTVAGFQDPYSQTIATDIQNLITSDQQFDADENGLTLLGAFSTDVKPFLAACGMTSN